MRLVACLADHGGAKGYCSYIREGQTVTVRGRVWKVRRLYSRSEPAPDGYGYATHKYDKDIYALYLDKCFLMTIGDIPFNVFSR